MIGALIGRFGAPLLAQAAVGLGIALVLATLALSGMTYLYLGKRDEVAASKAECRADINAIIATHASLVTKAAEDARADEKIQAGKRAAAELELARKDEAGARTRLNILNTQLRALKDAADADPELARCLALPLPDGLRREPTPP